MTWPTGSSWTDAALTVAAAVLLLALLAFLVSCLPLSGGFDTAAGGPARTALATVPTVPTVEVDNPFLCPKATAP